MMLNRDKEDPSCTQPFISIIITTLNGGRTLEQCLKSIDVQTLASFELIVVDAGSTDDTLRILEKYKHTVSKLKIIPKIGLYAGLNAGIRLASGQWLYFMGCDDQLADASTLQIVADAIDKSNREITVVAGNVCYQSSRYVMYPSFGSPYMMRFRLHHQGTFYHYSLFKDNLYNENMRISSDYEFNLRLGLRNEPYLKLNIPIAIYGESGISSEHYLKNIAEIQQVNSDVFKGLGRIWILSYNYFLTRLWLLRNRLGLLNLKQKIQKISTQVKK